ncbi:MAG: kelch repeat-containing protein [Candidatus Acidiferrales bacterium]
MKSQLTKVVASFGVLILILISWPQLVSAQERPKPIPHPFDLPQHAPARASAHSAASAVVNARNATSNASSGWTPLTNQAPSGPNGVQIMIQATDGSILVQSYDGQSWMKLMPDAKGSYINGTWTTLASEPVARLYFASQILPDGRLFVAGGEYSGPGLLPNWSNTGEIYDPLANAWTRIAPYPNQPGCPYLYYVSGNTTSGSAQITGIYPYASGLTVGEEVFGNGIPSPATIVSVDSPTQITISAPASQTVTANVITFNAYYELTGCLGDDPSSLLSSRKILVGDLVSANTYIYDPASNAWSPSGTKIYPDQSDEEGWTRTSEGTIVNYDLFQSIATDGRYAEKYNPKTGLWSSISPSDGTAGGTIPQLSSVNLGYELGPALRLQDGRVMVIGANQHTALYHPIGNNWSPGPDIRGTLNGIASPFGADDAPGAILPNGHVIFAADAGASAFTSSGNIATGSSVITHIPSTAILQVFWSVSGTGIPGGSYILSVDSPSQVTISNPATQTTAGDAISWGGTFSNPTELFEFDPVMNTIHQITSALPDGNLPFEGSYPTRMLILPTGQLLFSDSSSQLWIYTSDDQPNPFVRPFITKINYQGQGMFRLSGLQLDGQSAGAAYGDDDQMDSNYPIVRMVDEHGNVLYARTSNWSKVAVGAEAGIETVDFTPNPEITPGKYELIVSGAGISSFPFFIDIKQGQAKHVGD